LSIHFSSFQKFLPSFFAKNARTKICTGILDLSLFDWRGPSHRVFFHT